MWGGCWYWDEDLLSTTNVAPDVGVAVIAFPATSSATDITTDALPEPWSTVWAYVYTVVDVFVITVADTAFEPVIAIFGTGESATASLNVAVIVTASFFSYWPDLE